jgi:arylsulfatase A-like enzyme
MRIGIVTGLAAALEVGGTRLHPAVAATDPAKIANLVLAITLVFSVSALPMAGVGLAVDRWVDRGWWPSSARLLAAAAGTVLTALAVVVVVHFWDAIRANEFPARTDMLRALVLAAVVGTGIAGTSLLEGRLQRLATRSLWFPGCRALAVLTAGIVFLVCFLSVHLAMAPIHLAHEVRGASLFALAVLMLGTRWALPLVGNGTARAGAVLWVVACAIGLVSCQSDNTRFMLFAHCPTAASLAGGLRELADFDQDGAAPWWLGGADCAEFDAAVGPANLEVPGDGIDQDCRGGDASAPPIAEVPHSPWSECSSVPHRPNVLLITVDALRADVLTKRVMPNATEFAKVSTHFQRAYSPTTQTPFSMASLFAGRPASDLGTSNMLAHRDLDVGRPLPMRFRDAGYTTLLFNVLPLHRTLTIGFDHQNPGRELFDVYPKVPKLGFASAGLTTAVIASLATNPSRPFFTWVHYPDVHAPYLTSPEWNQPHSAPYESEAGYVDFHLGRLLNAIRSRGLEQSTIIVLTADHGEDLGERGREGHGPDVYESAVHVPLLVWVPGCAPRTILDPVSVSRLGPTLAFLCGVKTEGRSLLPHRGVDVPVVAEAVQVLDIFKRAIIGPRYKLIVDVRNGGRVLFDLEADPGETTDIYSDQPTIAAEMEARYQTWLDSPGQR